MTADAELAKMAFTVCAFVLVVVGFELGVELWAVFVLREVIRDESEDAFPLVDSDCKLMAVFETVLFKRETNNKNVELGLRLVSRLIFTVKSHSIWGGG